MHGSRMLNILCKIAGLVLLVAGIALPSGAQGGPFAYVTNQSSGSVTVIDTSTNTVVTTISLCGGCGPQPEGLAVTPNGNSVYVANSGNGTVSVIATSTNTVSTTIALCPACASPSTPVGIVITPDGTRAYVTDTSRNAIYVIDTNPNSATYNTVTATITADVSQPGAIAMSPDGSAAYYTFGTNSEGRIDTNPASATYNTHTTTFTVGNTPTGIAVTPDSTLLYVTNNGDGTVSVVTTGLTPTRVATVMVGTGPHFVAITPNGQFAYVVNESSNTVSVISTSSQSVVATISGSCIFTNQIAITPDGTQAYVADTECSTADVIITASNTQTTRVSVGSSPFGVAIGPPTNTVTVGPFPVFPGATVNFIDGTIINQKVTIPSDAMMNGVAFMEMKFTQVSPAVFNSTRLTGVLGNPWSGGNQGPYSSPPTTCTVITGTVGNANCMVMEGDCFDSAMNPLPTCNITKTTAQIILTSSYMTPFPQPTPGFLIADDGQNNWANILIGFDPTAFNLNDPTIHGGTNGCQMDTVIVNLGGPATPTPSSVNFGNVPVGGFPIRTVEITNSGTTSLNITAKVAPLPGQDSNDFFALSLCFKPLRPMQSCFIIVGFFADEVTHQQQSATLNINDGAPPANPRLIVPLSATVVKRVEE